jgi:hypothetical protein
LRVLALLTFLDLEEWKMRLAIALVVVLVASVALAAPTTHSPASNGTGTFEYEPSRHIKWMQLPLPGGNALASQYDYAYPFYAESADDFECIDGIPINAVEWWGQYWNPGYVCSAEYFVIRIYSYVPGPPWSMPGDLLAIYECFDYQEEFDPAYDQYHYFCELDPPFPQVVGEYYFISFQAVLVFTQCSQWGWCECDPIYYWGDEAVMDFELLGIPRWTNMTNATGSYYELAFVLHGPQSPVEESTWGSIKALFK